MLKKCFLSAALLFAFAAAFATDYARIDLNFWCNGNLKCITPKAPAGVQIVGRRKYSNPKHANICYYSITVNLSKVSPEGFELQYEVVDTGDKARAGIIPSITPIRLPATAGAPEVECLEFIIGDQDSLLTPCTIVKWTSILGPNRGITVAKGDTFTVKAKFRKSAK